MNGTIPLRWFNVIGSTQRGTQTQDSGGGVINTYAQNLASVPARLNIPKGAWNLERARENGYLTVKIFVPANPVPDILPKDRFILAGNVYDISAIRNPDLMGNYGGYLVLDATTVYPSAAVT